MSTSTVPADIGVVVAGRDDVTAFAAEELSRYLSEAAGSRVCRPIEGAPITIRVGGDAALPDAADEESFVVDTSSDPIVLAGASPRATLYAVYAFLEDAVGCRWLHPGDDIVPRLGRRDLIRAVTAFADRDERRVEAPDFPVRMRRFLVYDLGKAGTPLADQAMREMLLEIDWMAKNRMNILQYAIDHNWDCSTHWPHVRAAFPEMRKRGIVPGVGGHNMHMFMGQREFDAHPDWMPFHHGERQPRGQFCTGNEAAVQHYLNGLVTYLRDNPEIEYFAPWPNDTGGWCECELCRDTPSPDRFMVLGRRIYHELRERCPNVRVTHFAYGSHMAPPATERPDPGMTVTLCTWGRDLAAPFDSDGTSPRFREAFATWRDITRDADVPLILHEKYARHLYIGQHTLPVPAMQEDLRWFRGQGLAGFELPMAYMGRRTKGLNLYVLARLMWNADAPADDLVADHFRHEYGPLAETLERAYRRYERHHQDYRYSFQNYALLATSAEPGQTVTPALVAYAREARDAIATVLEWTRPERLRKTLGDHRDPDAILNRVCGFRRSLDYCDLEWQGVELMAEGARAFARAEGARTQDAYEGRLDEAAECFRRVRAIDARRRERALDPADMVVHWDATGHGPNGGFRSASIDGWLELIADRRTLEVAMLARRVWQIGVFDGSPAELGSDPDQTVAMLKVPKTLRFAVPDTWAAQDDWRDFPRSQWPESLGHGARLELVFEADAGAHRLTIGQMATGEAETVTVLLDGRESGTFTTTPGQTTAHEVDLAISEPGTHEIALAEFATGGGYMFDAIKLERLPDA